jgi:hypothetical protein
VLQRRLAWLVVGLVLGAAVGVAGGWAVWGRRLRGANERLATLETSAAQIQGERERLHTELSEIVRERREMADTAEHLRAQVEQQLRRLEALASELEPPAPVPDAPPADQ